MAANRFTLEFEKPILRLEEQLRELEQRQKAKGVDCAAEIRELRESLLGLQKKTFAGLTAWETVQLARHRDRPHPADYIEAVVKDFGELHGDRRYGDDKAIVCGLGRIGGERVMVIATRKGKETREKVACHFGCAHPEGYRKALRAMRMAAKFGLPVVSLIDTAGAYPGVEAEKRGIAEAIAYNIQQMFTLPVPVVAAVVGEGGSGGALGIGVGDRVAMMEFAYYSVISPEGCASILWKTAEQAHLAAEALRLTAKHLKRLGVIDEIIPEPLGGAHRDPAAAAAALERCVVRHLWELKRMTPDQLMEGRYRKYRSMGVTIGAAAAEAAAVQSAAG
jgi:acetyl-CoA carboxylase carboxyl transferase subunit alpha